MDHQCSQCDAKCCRYFCFQIDTPESFDEFEDVRWFLLHEGVSIHIDEGDWYISILNPCVKLGQDHRCTYYEERPVICRTYSQDNCDFTGGDYEYEELFESAEQLEAYARRTLGEKAYDKARRKAIEKIEKKQAKAALKARLAREKSGKAGRKARGQGRATTDIAAE